MKRILLLCAAGCLALTVHSAVAQVPAIFDAQEALDACRVLDDRLKRLECYDDIPGATVTGRDDDLMVAEPDRELLTRPGGETAVRRSRMLRDWELDDATHGGLLRVRTYRSVYALPARYTTRKNNFPSSPAPGRTVTESDRLNEVEAKFQFSFKTKVFDDPLFNNGDVWFGYTQQSSWQAYNNEESAPFRENNFEPEIFSTWRTGIDLGVVRWQFVNLGFVHQSNGRSQPRSRSWNRLYADFGFERGDWQFFIRPWLRADPENDDDNPDIEKFMGHGDVRVKWRKNKHDLRLLARWAPGHDRGALQFDWHYPLVGDLKAYLQVITGYGETLIDYNHRQTTIGLGVSLVQ